MSLKPQAVPPVPDETARVARAAFPKGNIYMKMRDALGTFFDEYDFSLLYGKRGAPGYAPWRLALITIFQFLEDLPDRQAADAVRSRIDWKYALSLELTDSGFDSTVLTEFRTRLIEAGVVDDLLTTLLEQFKAAGLLKARGKQRTDSTHVIAAINDLTRLGCVYETLRHAVEVLSDATPSWLRDVADAEWVTRYSQQGESFRIPKTDKERMALAETIGRDGWQLLVAIFDDVAMAWLHDVAAVETLRRVWLQQYVWYDDQLHWRDNTNTPPARLMIASPYDLDARLGFKRDIAWKGYKVHMTETCDEDNPHLIIHVDTTSAPVVDVERLDAIHTALATKELLPTQHIVDNGYIDAGELVRSKTEYGIDLIGPVITDGSWQAKAGQGYAASDFRLDWAAKTATCPQGVTTTRWQPMRDGCGTPRIKIQFPIAACRECPARKLCTRDTKERGRGLLVATYDEYMATQTRRAIQKTVEFTQLYGKRAGVEGTMSQSVRRCDVRHARYRGIGKTHFQNIATAAGLNIARVVNWLIAKPRATTRRSHFAALATTGLSFTAN